MFYTNTCSPVKGQQPSLTGLDSHPRQLDYRRKGIAAVAVRGALDLIARAGGGVVEGYPHDLQGRKIRSQFLYSATRSLFEEVGFSYERPKGKGIA
jgi:hypothetical protein